MIRFSDPFSLGVMLAWSDRLLGLAIRSGIAGVRITFIALGATIQVVVAINVERAKYVWTIPAEFLIDVQGVAI